MDTSTFGERFRLVTFGESHGAAIGAVIDGVRPGLDFDLERVQAELRRRRPGQSKVVSQRREADEVEVVSGVFEGKTLGTPICLLIRNTDAKPGHYEATRHLFRPGHADFTTLKKYGIRDWRGGGRSSGRETAARVAAGAVAQMVLDGSGVRVIGHVVRVGDVRATPQTPESLLRPRIDANPVRCADPAAAAKMQARIRDARKAGDSLGAVVEIVALGVPPGWGDPVFAKLDAELAGALMSIGAVKGVEFGDGFELSRLHGSRANDAITPGGFATNRAGGILGGISNGEPIVVRLAVKPTSSIPRPQQTIDTTGQPATIVVKGRHDPCIGPRLVPVAEAMTAIVLCEASLRQQAVREIQGAAGPEAAVSELARLDRQVLQAIARRRSLLQSLDPHLIDVDADLAGARNELAREEAAELGLPRELLSDIDRRTDPRPDLTAFDRKTDDTPRT
jgi:chorismate synthase